MEDNYKRSWERTRWLGWITVNSNPYLKTKISSPDKLYPFPWEIEEEEKNLDEFTKEIKELNWDSLALK